MAKIKFDVGDVDLDDAASIGNFEEPKPGVYRAKVKEMNPGFSKDSTGKPDKDRPRIEVVFEVLDDRYRGATLWSYLTFGEGFPKRKMTQFLIAFGIVKKGSKTAGEFDTNKIVNKTCMVRVKAGKNQDGEYRAEVGAVLPDTGESASDSSGDDDLVDDSAAVDDDIIGDDDESMVEDDGSEEGGEFDADARRAELLAASVDDLKAIVKEYKEGGADLTISGKKKAEVVEMIVAYEEETFSASDGEEETLADDDDIIADDDDVISDDGDGEEYLTDEQLRAMDNKTLVETAKQFDVAVKKGMTKSEVVAAILTAQAAPADDDAPPF